MLPLNMVMPAVKSAAGRVAWGAAIDVMRRAVEWINYAESKGGKG